MGKLTAFEAIMERLVEKTKAANPGVDIYKRKAKANRRVRVAKRIPRNRGTLH